MPGSGHPTDRCGSLRGTCGARWVGGFGPRRPHPRGERVLDHLLGPLQGVAGDEPVLAAVVERPAQHERLIRWWQDEIEGTGRVPILSVESKPEVLRFGDGTDADLRLAWQEFLLRVIADAFDLPAQFLGVERDVNRSTAAEMTEMAFRSAIVPTAIRACAAGARNRRRRSSRGTATSSRFRPTGERGA